MRVDYDVVVVGAGFAGATAARELATRGLRVLVLEAGDRIGGRTHTTALSDGTLVELGGTYMNWHQPHVWAEIVRYGLVDEVIPGGDAPEWTLAPVGGGNGWTPAADHAARESGLLTRFWEGSREIMPRPYDPLFAADAIRRADSRSIADRLDELDLPIDDRALLEAFLGSYTCVPADQAGLTADLRWWAPAGHNYASMEEAVFGYRLARGTVSLLSAILADGGPALRLNAPVTQVTQLGDAVKVGAFTASAVVLAVPSGEWPHVRFEPALTPERISAAREGMQASPVSKGFAVLRGERRRVSLLPRQPHPISMLATTALRGDDEQLAVFWGTGGLADPTDPQQLQDALQDLLPGVSVVEVAARAYRTEVPFQRGGWGVLKKHQLTRYAPHERFLRPEGRVAFATGDIGSLWQGYIDGAIETGLTAARQIRALLEA